jgi:hypothetical protein
MRILNLLVVFAIMLFAFAERPSYYNPVYNGYFEIHYNGEYTESIRSYSTMFINGDLFYCYLPNTIINSTETAKITICLNSKYTEMKEYR